MVLSIEEIFAVTLNSVMTDFCCFDLAHSFLLGIFVLCNYFYGLPVLISFYASFFFFRKTLTFSLFTVYVVMASNFDLWYFYGMSASYSLFHIFDFVPYCSIHYFIVFTRNVVQELPPKSIKASIICALWVIQRAWYISDLVCLGGDGGKVVSVWWFI